MDDAGVGASDLSGTGNVLWDVVDQHLDDAEFAIAQFERALQHPTRTLRDLARYPEQALLAHIDGLVVGGEPVRDRLLLPMLEDAAEVAPARMVAIALVLLWSGRHDLVCPLFAHPKPEVRAALARASELAANPTLDLWTVARLSLPCSPPETAALLRVLSTRGIAPPLLMQWLQSEDAELVAAAAAAATHGDPTVYQPVIEHLIDSSDVAIRTAALITALTWSSRHAWAKCEQLALDSVEPEPFVLSLYAALGGRHEHAQLASLLKKPAYRRHVLSAFALAGDAGLMPTLLETLTGRDPLEAKLSAQAIAALTGLSLRDDRYVVGSAAARSAADDELEARAALPALADDDLDADLVPVAETELPVPDANAIAAFWHDHAASVGANRRCLAGGSYSIPGVLEYLKHGPLRMHHGTSLALTIRTRGAIRIDTRVFSAARLRQLSAAERGTATLRQFTAW